MSRLQRLEQAIRRNEPIPWPVGVALSALTPLTRLGMAWRHRQPKTRVDARVISFGNITAGGSGKTPAVIERARQEIAAGRRVAVLTRGYGAPGDPEPVLVSADALRPDLAREIGDEPTLILRSAPGVVVVKCADRVAGAKAAIRDAHCDTLLLDDGFQYVMLERDENIVLVDASNPFGNEALVPRGILREPLSALSRATAFFLTRCDATRDLTALEARLRALCPAIPIRRTWHAPAGFFRVCDGMEADPEPWRGHPVTALCGIGNPDAFFATLESLGLNLGERIVLRNHASVPPELLARSGPVLLTEKDAIRLPQAPENVHALRIELRNYAGNDP